MLADRRSLSYLIWHFPFPCGPTSCPLRSWPERPLAAYCGSPTRTSQAAPLQPEPGQALEAACYAASASSASLCILTVCRARPRVVRPLLPQISQVRSPPLPPGRDAAPRFGSSGTSSPNSTRSLRSVRPSENATLFDLAHFAPQNPKPLSVLLAQAVPSPPQAPSPAVRSSLEPKPSLLSSFHSQVFPETRII